MSCPFQEPLRSLVAHIEDLRQCVAYIHDSTRLKASLGKVVNWQLGRTYETALADSFCKRQPLTVRPILNGLYLTAIAAFEQFLRESLVVGVREKIKRTAIFKNLGQSFANRHMEYSGRLLLGVHSPPVHLSIDYYDLCRRLGTCLPDSASFEVNEVALCSVRGITELEPFFECLDAFGYRITWDDLARNGNVQSCLGTKGTRDTAKQLKEAIQIAIRDRNRIAHSGQSYAEMTEKVFEGKLSLLEVTAIAIVHHMSKSETVAVTAS